MPSLYFPVQNAHVKIQICQTSFNTYRKILEKKPQVIYTTIGISYWKGNLQSVSVDFKVGRYTCLATLN